MSANLNPSLLTGDLCHLMNYRTDMEILEQYTMLYMTGYRDTY
jgi:hypothetical protein